MHQFTPTSIRTSTQNLVFMSYPHTINRTSTTINQTNPHNLNLCTHTSFTTLKSKSGSNVLPRYYEPTSPHKLTYRHVQTSQPWSQNLVQMSYPNTINRATAHILNLSTHTSFTTINASFLIMKLKWVFVSGFFPLCSKVRRRVVGVKSIEAQRAMSRFLFVALSRSTCCSFYCVTRCLPYLENWFCNVIFP